MAMITNALESMSKNDFALLGTGVYTVPITAPNGAECTFLLHLRKSSTGVREACFDLYPSNLNYTIRTEHRDRARFFDNQAKGISSFGHNQITFCFPEGEQGERLFGAAQFICDPKNLEPITEELI